MVSPYLILAITSLLSSSVLSSEWLECDPPKSFTVELENNNRLFVYDAEVNVKFDRNDLAVYDYPGYEDVNILINNTIISFSGYILLENEEVTPDTFKISRIFDSKIAGFGRLSKATNGTVTLADYNVYLSRNHDENEINIPKKVQVEIIHEAVSCIKSTIHKKIGTIQPEDMDRAKKNPYDFGSISVSSGNISDLRYKARHPYHHREPTISTEDIKFILSNYSNIDPNNVEQFGFMQEALNKVVDLAVAVLVRRMREENEGKIRIPDLNQNFSTGSSWWKTTGEFNAFDGTFQDLTTLGRTDNVILFREGLRFMAVSEFSLPLANMNYLDYALRYGIIKVNGKMSAAIDGVSVLASGSIDFTKRPCEAVLLDLRVSKLGKMKVKMTGLGPLNKLLSRIVTIITEKWQEDIVTEVEEKFREIIAKLMEKFSCEKYRFN